MSELNVKDIVAETNQEIRQTRIDNFRRTIVRKICCISENTELIASIRKEADDKIAEIEAHNEGHRKEIREAQLELPADVVI